jgi:hypothetical protein
MLWSRVGEDAETKSAIAKTKTSFFQPMLCGSPKLRAEPNARSPDAREPTDELRSRMHDIETDSDARSEP